jgi:hypothetical protein
MNDESKALNKKDQQRLDEGRGQGSLSTYKPFILVGEFSSSGESVRVKSHITNRVHHFHSGIEFAAFLVFAYSNQAVDIREQFPLPLVDSLNICKQLGIKHPQVKSELYIVTTDLVINLKSGKKLAIAVKPVSKLNQKRTIAKLQIERSYWESQGVDWLLFTDKEVSPSLKQNLHWLKPFLDPESSEEYDVTEEDVNALIERFGKYTSGKVSKVCGRLDDQYQVDGGTHITIFRYAVANYFIKIPINKVFHELQLSDLFACNTPLKTLDISDAS